MEEQDTKEENFDVCFSELETNKSKKFFNIRNVISAVIIVVVGMTIILSSSPVKKEERNKVRVLGDDGIIILPEPKKSGGLPLNEALSRRQSIKEFSDSGELTLEELSQLLWACYGINRPGTVKKTVPSSEAWYPFDVYVFMKTGIYFYEPNEHKLILYRSGDMRSVTGGDSYVPYAYANICLFGKYSRVPINDINMKRFDMELDAGYSTQNMYFVGASEGFNTVVRAGINMKGLLDVMGFNIQEYYPPICYSAGR